MEPFTILEKEEKKTFHLHDEMVHLESAKTADHDLQYVAALRKEFPDKIVTAVPQVSANIIAYAHAGNAILKLDTSTDSYSSWKGYVQPALRSGKGSLGEATQFAKYKLSWKDTDFVLYLVQIGFSAAQYILADRKKGEDVYGPSNITDSLIISVGEWQHSDDEVVWVYDNYWRQDKALYQQVKKASWDKVILDEEQKKDLVAVSNTFFSSKAIYEDLGVPWKRGLLFHGPPGNGKTVSIKALMNTLLFKRGDKAIPTLYVKSAIYTWNIGQVFQQARRLSPCMVVLEDVETIVTPQNRSYFFNEMDGLENNDGLFIVASTNYLERLDPGLTKRPSRFDRKYLFPLPNEHERTLYCQFWQTKLKKNNNIEFPDKLCPAMAHITPGFSFAFLQECFVATMLQLARDAEENTLDDGLDEYELWRAFKAQADVLRKQIGDYTDDSSLDTLLYEGAPPTPAQHAPLSIRGFDKTTGQQIELTSASSSAGTALSFNDRKQPEISTAVYSWVAPRGYIG